MSAREVRAEDVFDVPAVAAWLAARADPGRAGVDSPPSRRSPVLEVPR